MLAECNGWVLADYDGDAEFFVSVQGCVRAVYALGRRNFAYMDRVPYVCARFRIEPATIDRAIQQWGAAPHGAHDDVTVSLLSLAGHLRAQLDEMNATGHVAADLDHELRGIELIPLDDSVGETPHALANVEQGRARSGAWGWAASTMRLEQNLQSAQDFGFADVQQRWSIYSSVLKPFGARRRHSKLQLPRRELEARFYAMHHCKFAAMFAHGGSVPGMPPALEDAGGPPASEGAGEPPPPLDDGASSPADRGGGSSDDGSGDGCDGDNDARGARRVVDRNDEAVRLMRQYLSHALQPLSYVSVPLARGDDTEDSADEFFLGEPAEMVFQALGLESRSVLVPCYEDKLKESLLMSAMVQRVHVWQSRGQGLGRALEIYNPEDPMEIDILRLVGFAVDRQKILTWTVEASGVEGCLTLKGPSVAKPLMALQSPNVPCLTLMDELARQGFRAVQRSVAHAVGAEMVFDARRADSQRCYFQRALGRAAI